MSISLLKVVRWAFGHVSSIEVRIAGNFTLFAGEAAISGMNGVLPENLIF